MRGNAERVCGCDKVCFVVRQKIEHRDEHRWIAEAAAQGIRREAGERQKSIRSIAIAEHPAERLKRQRSRIGDGGRLTNDCQDLSGSIEQ